MIYFGSALRVASRLWKDFLDYVISV